MFRKMPIILLTVILAVVLCDPWIPHGVKQGLFSMSLTIKSLIMFVLPWVILGLLFKVTVQLANQATKVIGMILVLVCCSNFISTFLSHFVGEWVYHFDLSMIKPNTSGALMPLWVIHLPTLLANNKAMFAGIFLGFIGSKWQPRRAYTLSEHVETMINKLLKSFVYIVPLFVAGYVVKLQADGVMHVIIKDYSGIFIIVALAQFSYITFAYWVWNSGRLQSTWFNIKNMMPAAISGFCTMSSAASMPFSMLGVAANAKNKELASSIIPATVNIHLVGDCFAIPIFAYAILKSFGMPEPSLMQYLVFIFYFIIAKFSVAAIPGGGIIVMLPILERYMGFNAEMMSLITALYILMDPLITCANVLGNGAFAKMADQLLTSEDKPTQNAAFSMCK